MTTNGREQNDPLDQVDEAIGKLEGTQWDEDSTVQHIHAETVIMADRVDNTGRFQAVEVVTKPDNPKAESDAPPSNILQKGANAAVSILRVVNNPWAFGALFVLVVGGVVVYWLRLSYGH